METARSSSPKRRHYTQHRHGGITQKQEPH